MDFKFGYFTLVVTGILFLLYSLRSTLFLCKQPPSEIGWKILSGLIVFFVVGYSLFAWHVLNYGTSFIERIVAFILFFGSCFVVLVIRLSRRSIEQSDRLTALARHHALHDDLTGLPNRKFLHQRIDDLLDFDQDEKSNSAVLLMDLDRFKEVNDTLGHHVGDQLLQQISPRLHGLMRDSDTIARFGGDEFAAILPSADQDTAIQVAQRILRSVEIPFRVEQHTLRVSLSIGICVYPDDGENRETLLRHADVAMYVAKRNGVGYSIYRKKQDQYSINRLKLSTQLRDVIKQGMLELYYQPIIGLEDESLYAMEVLARWPRENDEVLTANEFIPIAENTGMIRNLTRWGLNSAISQLASWRQQGIDCAVTVNLSIKDLQDTEFSGLVDALLSEYSLPPEKLILEITESSVMTDLQQVEQSLERLNRLGVLLAIDDFGTGYSSLYRLKKMPISVIKIDSSFILGLSEDENDQVIVRSTIDLGHNLGKTIVAEGVETGATVDILKHLECDYIQGYEISKPLPSCHVTAWLDRHRDRNKDSLPAVDRRLNQ